MRQPIQAVAQKRLLHLLPEVRLIIYRFVLVHDSPISLTKYFALDCSLLRTCRLFRREGIPLFFERNRFILQTTSSRAINRLSKRLKGYRDLIRYMTVDFRFESLSHTDLIWNLMRAQQESGPTLEAVLLKFHFLHALSFQLTIPSTCLQHRTLMEEAFCASFRAGCTELTREMQEQCRIFGTVEAHYLDDESLMITLYPSQTNSNNF